MDQTRFSDNYGFVPFVQSPGLALIIIGDEKGTAANLLLKSLAFCFPVLFLSIAMLWVSSLAMWFVVSNLFVIHCHLCTTAIFYFVVSSPSRYQSLMTSFFWIFGRTKEHEPFFILFKIYCVLFYFQRKLQLMNATFLAIFYKEAGKRCGGRLLPWQLSGKTTMTDDLNKLMEEIGNEYMNKWASEQVRELMPGWLIDCGLTVWPTGFLTDWLTVWLTDWTTNKQIDGPNNEITNRLIDGTPN